MLAHPGGWNSLRRIFPENALFIIALAAFLAGLVLLNG